MRLFKITSLHSPPRKVRRPEEHQNTFFTKWVPLKLVSPSSSASLNRRKNSEGGNWSTAAVQVNWQLIG